MKKSAFDFGFADDDDDKDNDGPSLDNIGINLKQPSKPLTKTGVSHDLTSTFKQSQMRPTEVTSLGKSTQQKNPLSSSMDQSANSIQTASQRIQELNKVELPSGSGMPQDEIFGDDGVDMDYELQNQQNMYAQSNLPSKIGTNKTTQEIEINTDSNDFHLTKTKFSKLNHNEMQKNDGFERSRQEVIAGKILRIKAEMNMLQNQLKQNSYMVQQAGEATKTSDQSNLQNLQN